ncbi:hypothetical protein B9Z55_016458 [Caenorhabditis nigoni]|uniref:Uncharacterized protein n=1 Tax=Caenorhabditis nigoni TaxID=1611254 RepID=A0A2G5T5L1_9PELO|nr:hypothetical protein B9Z55_016458 [Caenorhabditis nigoni]
MATIIFEVLRANLAFQGMLFLGIRGFRVLSLFPFGIFNYFLLVSPDFADCFNILRDVSAFDGQVHVDFQFRELALLHPYS